MNDELWADIQGCEGYKISSYGVVKCFMWDKTNGRILKPQKTIGGYYAVKIRDKHYNIHRLVAIHFLERIDGKDCVDHIDRDKLNNHVSNLRWCDKRDNSLNRGLPKNNKSGHKGIFYRQDRNSYIVFWMVEKKKRKSKMFPTLEEAIAFRDEVFKNGDLFIR